MQRKIVSILLLLMNITCLLPAASGQMNDSTSGATNEKYIRFYLYTGAGGSYNKERVKPVRVAIRDNFLYEYFTFAKGGRTYEKNIIGLGVKPSDQFLFENEERVVKNFTKSYISYQLADTSQVEVIAMGITPENKDQYHFRIIENDSVEIQPWQSFTQFQQRYGATRPYAVIGLFRQPGKLLLIEVKDKQHTGIRDGVLLSWRKSLPPKLKWGTVTVADSEKKSRLSSIVKSGDIDHTYVTRFDEITLLPLDLTIPAGLQSPEGFPASKELAFGLEEHTGFPYEVLLTRSLTGISDTLMINPEFEGQFLSVPGKYFKTPGKYELLIRLKSDPGISNTIIIPFRVKDPPLLQKTVSLRQMLPYTIATLSGVALVFLGYRQSSRRKIAKAAQQKEVIHLQLKSVRSQLNPHFMFNALSSIQNLMNQHDISKANHYLGKFAGLTRQVLQTADHELVSLEDDLKALDDYLQMEKLRFGFHYTIRVDDQVNKANTEVPSMLLQPFVENAVKHGIAGLQASGKIDICVYREVNNLVMLVNDNGKGFREGTDPEKTGWGLKLSEERIALLNQLYKGRPASLKINSGVTGTIVCIELNNWF